MRLRYFLATFIIILCLALSVFAAPPLLLAHFIDVGQADCILVQTPNGRNMLIDAGNNADWPLIDAYLKSKQISRLDVVIGTHPHEDHIGSLDQVISHYDIGQIYMTKVSANTKSFRDLLLAIKKKGLKVNTAKAGVVLDLGPDVQAVLLAPNSNHYDDTNDYSAVLHLVYGNTSFLFTGDASKPSEYEMLRNGLPKADVLKVGHHGSRSSTTEAFLKAVSPSIGVISVEADNSYGHPTRETLERLARHHIQVLRTDQDGTVIVTSDGQTIKVDKSASPVKPHGPPVVNSSSQDDDVIVYITKTGTKYHVEGCRFLRKSRIPITLKEAKARGFTACKVCGAPE